MDHTDIAQSKLGSKAQYHWLEIIQMLSKCNGAEKYVEGINYIIIMLYVNILSDILLTLEESTCP